MSCLLHSPCLPGPEGGCLLFPPAWDDAQLDNRYQFIRSLSPNVMPYHYNLLQKQLNPNFASVLLRLGAGSVLCLHQVHLEWNSLPTATESKNFLIFFGFLLCNKLGVRSETIITKLLPNMTEESFENFVIQQQVNLIVYICSNFLPKK